MPWEETDEFIRSGHRSTTDFDKDSFRTIDIDPDKGVKAVIGCPRGHFKAGKCDGGTEVQSFLFAKNKGWNLNEAKKWFKDHEETTAGTGGQRRGRRT
jgi:hypothetical protein